MSECSVHFFGAYLARQTTLVRYVDDIVYFSKDPKVEEAFEQKFGDLTTVDFMGLVSFFLGTKFEWQRNG